MDSNLPRRKLLPAFAHYNGLTCEKFATMKEKERENLRRGPETNANGQTTNGNFRGGQSTSGAKNWQNSGSAGQSKNKKNRRGVGKFPGNGRETGETPNFQASDGKNSGEKKGKKRKGRSGNKKDKGNGAKKQRTEEPNIANAGDKAATYATATPVEASGIGKMFSQLTHVDSLANAQLAFGWLIGPVLVGNFFKEHWETKPLHVQRKDRDYYAGLFSSEKLDAILREHDIQYTVNLDITKYENGERETLNPIGRAYVNTVSNFYKEGCSVRLLNPQTYSDEVWRLSATLQELFRTFVGANVYLTPASTQGFAPHFDDIEAFVLQLEGVKSWRIYKPRNIAEVLPRFSSPNFKRDQIGAPILEVEMHPGDLLYFPRGFIHEAMASKDTHSLHITISSTQRNTWGDLMQKWIEQAVQLAMEENVEFRRALPLDYMETAGAVHMEKGKKGRKEFLNNVRLHLTQLIDYGDTDGAVDQMAKTFMQDSLPPYLSEEEKRHTICGAGRDPVIFIPETKIRLIRRNCLRLAMECEESVTVYYNTENSRIYREKDSQRFAVATDLAAGIDYLVEHYPKLVLVKDLPLKSLAERSRICQMLYEKALLFVE